MVKRTFISDSPQEENENKGSVEFLWNFLVGVVLGTLLLTTLSLMGRFSLRNKEIPKPLLSQVGLVKNEESPLVQSSTKDIVESHLVYRVKVKRGTLRKGSLHLFSLKNGGGLSLGYAPNKDNTGADFRLAVDFLKTQNSSDAHETTSEERFLEAHDPHETIIEEFLEAHDPHETIIEEFLEAHDPHETIIEEFLEAHDPHETTLEDRFLEAHDPHETTLEDRFLEAHDPHETTLEEFLFLEAHDPHETTLEEFLFLEAHDPHETTLEKFLFLEAHDPHETTLEDRFLEAHLINIFPRNVNLSEPSPGDRNRTTQTAPRDQKSRKQVWMIHSERKQRKQMRKRRLRPYWPELLDTSYYRPFTSPLENGVARGGSVRLLRRPFRGSFGGYAADQDGTAYGGGADFWDYFDTEKGSDHFRVSEFSEFEIGVHSMDLEELKTEREQYRSRILEGKDLITRSEKRRFHDQKEAVVRYENGIGKLVKKLRPNELEIQVDPNSEWWQFEVSTVQKAIASSIALFSAKLKRIEEEISIRERQLKHAEEAPDKPHIREKKNPAAMLRYKRQPGKKLLSRSRQKPIGQHDWRHCQRDAISYYRPLKRIEASKNKKTSPIFQYRNTVQVDNTLQLDFKVVHNDVFDVTEESN
uniref:Uncharacterized protein n=1 Tax=Corydalis conspersa TaxID=2182691 RepID=A0A6G8J410_9MAGN|nr:hypothetical protein [Corydalis conspersa]YP_009758180.1 hypothetical protein [Corydalis conspersa]QIM61589.1 hypothetical protein [Corydalis conspersa]QIM61590.1 hypothetical protein [Corydalis conspersa]